MKTFLAIDFGTTQTSVARLQEHSKQAPEVIDVNDGQNTVKAIATALQLDDHQNIAYFGAKALEKAEEAPERTFQNFKVFVGKNSREYQLKTEQNSYTPEDLALLYLRELREKIEEHAFNGSKLSDSQELTCIIGCPSDFSEVQKKTLKDIAVKAGFPNPKLCDEPIGVIYYNHFFGDLELKPSQNILVYDFGGGTTDVAIARVKVSGNGKIEPSIFSVSGLPDLGGRNFDEAIADYYMKENNYDLRTVPVKDKLHDQWMINLAARQAKEYLSSKTSVANTVRRLKAIDQKPNELSLSREQFNQICAGLIEQFDDPIDNALMLAGLSVNDIDVVILAGGSSAMPYVQESMRKVFSSSKAKILVSSEIEIIAQGLAVYGRVEGLGMKAKKDEAETSEKFANPQSNNMSNYFENEKAKSQTPESTPTTQSTKKKRKWLWVAIIGVVVVFGGLIYQVLQMNQENAALQDRLAYEHQSRLAYEQQLRQNQQSSNSSSQSNQSPSAGSVVTKGVAGAAIGATVGSFIPLVGTAVGAAIGGGVGILYGTIVGD